MANRNVNSPDAALLLLAAKLAKANDNLNRVCVNDKRGEGVSDADFWALIEPTKKISAEILQHPANTIEGVMVKIRALGVLHWDEHNNAAFAPGVEPSRQPDGSMDPYDSDYGCGKTAGEIIHEIGQDIYRLANAEGGAK